VQASRGQPVARAFTSTPRRTSSMIVSAWPLCAARKIGCSPWRPAALSAPLRASAARMPCWPCAAAK
jgi:hypothetical protein